jgi:hypothetical protein
MPTQVSTARALDATEVASATPADPTAVQQYLSHSSFGTAYIRIWTQDVNYVTLLAVAFNDQADAGRMVQLEVDQLRKAGNTYVTAHQDLAGSYAFVISSVTRAGGKTVICEGVWLPVSSYAIETLTCSDRGAWATTAEDLAKQESDLAQRAAR